MATMGRRFRVVMGQKSFSPDGGGRQEMSYLILNDEDQQPLDICMETMTWILALGTVNEIVKKQPNNTRAAERKVELEANLKEHLEKCQRCVDGLKEQK